MIPVLFCLIASASGLLANPPAPIFNRPPLAAKPYSELPLGAIAPEGWLKWQLETMANGMTGHLDELYPEVIGDRNGWLGGDGDGWERGPYWIDGALPLAHLIQDEALLAKANRWVEWTLQNQRKDGYIGPVPFASPPQPEPGLQRGNRDDWWPKMVMLKILQQHYMATGDQRVIDCLTGYFKYQLNQLPTQPLDHRTYWGNRRGADNLMVVYWLYNITGDAFLLDLGETLAEQTHPYSDIFLEREKVKRMRMGSRSDYAFHCVNLAQGIKAPIIQYQADPDPRHLKSVVLAFKDIKDAHGQPHGLYGGDEGMHGTGLTQGSELCTTIEMMFSLEKMLEITGNMEFADRLESVAYNLLPTQVSDDYMTRQYYQQANQVQCTEGKRNFIQDRLGDRIVYGLLSGYPCCTCNLHQGWPKFTQHLWMASADNGLAALVYAPCKVTTRVDSGKQVTITESTNYPFSDEIKFIVSTETVVDFPLHLRIPAWCSNPSVSLNGQTLSIEQEQDRAIIDREWRDGDTLILKLPSELRAQRWRENSVSLYKGPLLFALRIGEEWSDSGKGFREVRPTDPWNYALIEQHVANPSQHFEVRTNSNIEGNPWSLDGAPIEILGKGVEHPLWNLYNESAGPVPWSPQRMPAGVKQQSITLIPYGSTTLRISAFPTFQRRR